MANLSNVVKITREDFENGDYTYDANSAYLVGGGSALLWRNNNPSAQMGSSSTTGYVSIDIPTNVTKFKYLKFLVETTTSSGDGVIEFIYLNPAYQAVIGPTTSFVNNEFNFFIVDSLGQTFGRYLELVLELDSSTVSIVPKMRVYTGRYCERDGTLHNPYNYSMVPLEIWGTNRL